MYEINIKLVSLLIRLVFDVWILWAWWHARGGRCLLERLLSSYNVHGCVTLCLGLTRQALRCGIERCVRMVAWMRVHSLNQSTGRPTSLSRRHSDLCTRHMEGKRAVRLPTPGFRGRIDRCRETALVIPDPYDGTITHADRAFLLPPPFPQSSNTNDCLELVHLVCLHIPVLQYTGMLRPTSQ